MYLLLLDVRASGWRKLWKAVGVLVGVYGIIMLVGAATGGTDPLQPLARFNATNLATPVATRSAHNRGLQFTRIKTLADLNQALARASRAHQTAMLDFYADWCVSCKEMEHAAFMDADVNAALANTLLVQADVTANDAEDQALLKHFGIYGPPSIMFFNASGQELTADRVVGYMGARDFETRIRQTFSTATGAVN